jgi:hypothetical protein
MTKQTHPDNDENSMNGDDDPSPEAIEAEYQRLRRVAVRAAMDNWRSTLKDIKSGKDLAASLGWRVLAGSESARQRCAKAHFSEEHFEHLTSLDFAAVLQQLKPWLEDAIIYLLGEDDPDDTEDRKRRDFALLELVNCQYVAVFFSFGADEECDPPSIVQGFPLESVMYGDLYEFTAAGVSCGGTLYLYKSTGEPFLPGERRSAIAGIRRNFFANAASDGEEPGAWELEFFDYSDEARIGVFVTEKED